MSQLMAWSKRSYSAATATSSSTNRTTPASSLLRPIAWRCVKSRSRCWRLQHGMLAPDVVSARGGFGGGFHGGGGGFHGGFGGGGFHGGGSFGGGGFHAVGFNGGGLR